MPERNGSRAGVALVVGVGNYLRTEQIDSLRFAARDAGSLADALADPELCAFPQEQVLLLTDAEASRDAIVHRLSRWLPERARGTDLTVIYFAGHGMVQAIGRREEGFLLPYDADPDDLVTRGIAMSDVASWIDGLQSRAVVVCLDCCHSGKVLGSRGQPSASRARNMELRPAVLEGMSGRGRYLIASCDQGQQSFECDDLGHGLFTFHLLEGIAGAADRDGDGQVGLAELFNYVATAVSRDARQRFGCDQKPWTSATWAEETYISSPTTRTSTFVSTAGDRPGRDPGGPAPAPAIEQLILQGDEEGVKQSLRLLGRRKELAGIGPLFRCLGHPSETIRNEALRTVHAFGWDTLATGVAGMARGSDPATMTAVLDGLTAIEAHPRVVNLLDQLVVLLKGELRNRAILLLERKRLGLGLDRVAALFREIHSPYQIQKALGQGLFTETYLARDEATGLEVVVRVLRPEFAGQPQVRARFLDLCQQSVHLVHDKLALTREARAFPEQNVYFAVRDYVPGVTLQRVLEGGKRFEPPQVIRLLREVAEGLTPLHRKGLCHGAIKPSNVFLSEDDRVILGDPSLPAQGIGVVLDRLAYDYRYAAPELFQGTGTPGPSSDFYALGCVAYELFCGQPPFVSDNFHELAACHLHDPVLPPGQRGCPVSLGVNRLLLKLLARSPAERYDTLRDVLLALASLETRPEEPPEASGGQPHGPSGPGPAPAPILRESSLLNYQAGQSVLNLDQSGVPLTGEWAASQLESVGELPGEPKGPLVLPGYDILETLGQGGMGVVYKARQWSLHRLVVLKVVHRSISGEGKHRFRREAEALARLQHPNIVQVFDALEYQGNAFLAMEFVEGGDLARKLRAGPLPFRETAGFLAILARAVHFAHQRGILHRDLKPSNILLTAEGLPKITDFGLAKLQHDNEAHLTIEGTILGTPAYMAPEQIQGKADAASDLFALGVIFYEMLTGSRPYPSTSGLEALMARILSEKPIPPRQRRPEIPRELEVICLKCLEKDPARRYASGAALADDLDLWLQGKLVTRPPTLWQRLTRFFSFRK